MSHNANQSFAGESPAASYRPRDPTQALIYQVVQKNWLSFVRDREEEGRYLPSHIKREFQAFMGCGVLANGFVRLKCDGCKHEKLVAFSCKKRGFCSSCGARRMSEQTAFYTDWVFPEAPVRQWVISFPMPLRYW
ncbi:transposase zinc-binding domain-containing protein, partial [Bdellovibrionota bacterium FG-2]